MKTTKGGKALNPTDAFRKKQRKKELKRVRVFEQSYWFLIELLNVVRPVVFWNLASG